MDLPRAPVNPYLGLTLATIAVSFSAILIKESAAPPVVIAAYRLAITTALLAPLVRGKRLARIAALTPRELAVIALAGVLLALHFAFWNASLGYTSVASSVLFVSVHPALIAAMAPAVLGEYPGRRGTIGIALTLVGSAIVAGGDLQLSGSAARGDGLALLGAVVFAGYLMIGRGGHADLDTISYSTVAYAICAVALVALTFPTHQSLAAVGPRDLLIFLALAVVCTLGGHLLYNWTLRYLAAAIVSVSFLGEPVLAALLAWPILGQALAAGTIAGGAVILGGIWLTARS